MPKKTSPKWLSAVVRTVITVALLFLLWTPILPLLRTNRVHKIPYSEFLNNVRQGKVQAVEISSGEIRGQLRPEQGKKANSPSRISAIRPPDINDPDLLPLLRSNKVEIVGKLENAGVWRSLLISALPMLFLIGFWIWIFRKVGRGQQQALQSRQSL
jgi:cell division protease FtsH